MLQTVSAEDCVFVSAGVRETGIGPLPLYCSLLYWGGYGPKVNKNSMKFLTILHVAFSSVGICLVAIDLCYRSRVSIKLF